MNISWPGLSGGYASQRYAELKKNTSTCPSSEKVYLSTSPNTRLCLHALLKVSKTKLYFGLPAVALVS